MIIISIGTSQNNIRGSIVSENTSPNTVFTLNVIHGGSGGNITSYSVGSVTVTIIDDTNFYARTGDSNKINHLTITGVKFR